MCRYQAVQFYTVVKSLDALKRPQETETLGTAVPCLEDRVGFTVTFQAMQAGAIASVRLKVRKSDYSGQTHFLYGGQRYHVLTAQKEPHEFVTIVGETI